MVPYFAMWTAAQVTRQFGRWPQSLPHGAWYKNIWPLYQRHVTLDQLTTLESCGFRADSAVRLDAVTFTNGVRGARPHPGATTQRSTVLGARPPSYPTISTSVGQALGYNNLSRPKHVLGASAISFFSVLSPEKYLVRGTDHVGICRSVVISSSRPLISAKTWEYLNYITCLI